MFTEKEAREKVCLPMALQMVLAPPSPTRGGVCRDSDIPQPLCLASECIRWEWEEWLAGKLSLDYLAYFYGDGIDTYPERGYCSCGGNLEK